MRKSGKFSQWKLKGLFDFRSSAFDSLFVILVLSLCSLIVISDSNSEQLLTEGVRQKAEKNDHRIEQSTLRPTAHNNGQKVEATIIEDSKHYVDNGALQLVIQAYVDKILQTFPSLNKDSSRARSKRSLPIINTFQYKTSNPFDKRELSLLQIRKMLAELPRKVANHPALKQKRLYVRTNQNGPNSRDPDWLNNRVAADALEQFEKPEDPQPVDPIDELLNSGTATDWQNNEVPSNDLIETYDGLPRYNDTKPLKTTSQNSGQSGKRRRHIFPAEEICRTFRQWELINKTTDIYAQDVEIIHTDQFQQYVFVYRCTAQNGPCLGISPLYNSECEMRYGWMNLYHRKMDNPLAPAQWGFVAVPHHCACKITPKFIPNKSFTFN